MQQSYAKRAAAQGSQLLVQRAQRGAKPAGDDACLHGQGALIFKAQWIPKSKKIAFSATFTC